MTNDDISCFSISSREEWGGNLLMLILSLVFVLIEGDYFAALFSLTGIISGAVGWIIAIYFYDKVNRPLKSGKYIFGKANKEVDKGSITVGVFFAVQSAILIYAAIN